MGRNRLAVRFALAALSVTWMSAAAAAADSGAAAPATAAPHLAVIVSVDGLSWARLLAYRPWYTAGLKRLLASGWSERSARYRHLNTETGPGHASLASGAPPKSGKRQRQQRTTKRGRE